MKAKNQTENMAEAENVAEARERKRARFEQPEGVLSKWRFTITLSIVAIAITMAILSATGMFSRTGENGGPRVDPHDPKVAQKAGVAAPAGPAGASAATATAISADGDLFRLPEQSISGQASFFKAETGSGIVPFFVVRDSSGQVHVALDACQSCAAAKQGYTQVGDSMQCKKCGELFQVANITKMGGRGGCHPIALQSSKDGKSLTIKRGDIEAGARYF